MTREGRCEYSTACHLADEQRADAIHTPSLQTRRDDQARGSASLKRASCVDLRITDQRMSWPQDGLFACKSCTRFCTKSADKMHAHYTLCVTGPFEDPVPSDASFAEPSPDEESSATESDDDYQRRVKTTARSTDRKKASRAAKTTAVKTEKGVTPVKKEPTPRRRSEKAVGISGGSRVGKRRKAEEAMSTPAVSTSSVSPAKRKLPAAPVPTTARPSKRRNATPSSTPPPARSSAGRAPEETTATDGELHLEGKVVRVKGKSTSPCLNVAPVCRSDDGRADGRSSEQPRRFSSTGRATTFA
jgi:hypothetical protein